MALTYTLAGLQAVLDQVDTAITAEEWGTAQKHIARANLVLSGLPASTASDTQTVSMRQDLRAAADLVGKAMEETEKQNNQTRRLGRVGVRGLTGQSLRRVR